MGAGKGKVGAAGGGNNPVVGGGGGAGGGERNLDSYEGRSNWSEYSLSQEQFDSLQEGEQNSYLLSLEHLDKGGSIQDAVSILKKAGFLDVTIDERIFKPETIVKERIIQPEIKKLTEKTFMKHYQAVFGDIDPSAPGAGRKLQMRAMDILGEYKENMTKEEKAFSRYVGNLPIRVVSETLTDVLRGRPFGTSNPSILKGQKEIKERIVEKSAENKAYNRTVSANALTFARMVSGLKSALNGYEEGSKAPIKLQKASITVPKNKDLASYNGMIWGVKSKEGGKEVSEFMRAINVTGALSETKSNNTGHNIGGSRVKSSIAHEFGHYLQDIIGDLTPRSVTSKMTKKQSDRFEYFTSSHQEDYIYRSGDFKKYGDSLGSAVSGYGNKSHAEAFAEASSAYIMGATPTKGTKYYSEFKEFMKDVGLSHLEGIGRKID